MQALGFTLLLKKKKKKKSHRINFSVMFYLQNLVTNTVYFYMIFVLCISPVQLGKKKKKVKKKQCQLGKGLPASKLVWHEEKKKLSVPGTSIVILHQCLHKEQLPEGRGRLGGKGRLCFKLSSFPAPSTGSVSHLQIIKTAWALCWAVS